MTAGIGVLSDRASRRAAADAEPDPHDRPTAGDRVAATEASIRAVEAELGTLFASVRDLRRRSAAGVHPGLSPAGYRVLLLLAKHGPLRASAIAELLEVDRSAVSRALPALEALGLIERQPDEEDGRAHLVALTPPGTRRMAEVLDDQRATLRRSFRPWSPEDIDHLAQLLGQFNAMASETYRP